MLDGRRDFQSKMLIANCAETESLRYPPLFQSSFGDWTAQVGLLTCALDNTLPGGVVVYATCALSEIENDLVVQSALDDRRTSLLSDSFDVPGMQIESTRYGWRVLPDLEGGWGPLYWAALTRQSLARSR